MLSRSISAVGLLNASSLNESLLHERIITGSKTRKMYPGFLGIGNESTQSNLN
jgi:hypothetical protein